ncbi:serine hydrolase domain-containing protein [Phenylobacterium sp.]|uniref:serine hydrolase domain-containing protein n=1 Tax=Phenylobacterium sp. TaxID=1871053 RepID=UPI0025EF9C49|nr:serine hydrolase domain-containing protein [Phenylobacterium sp.]
MQRWFAAAAALLLWATPCFAQDLDATLKAAMTGTQTPAVGLLVIRGGKVVGQAVQGVRRNDGSRPATMNDVWLIGSDGKPMTATLIARLVDRGVLSWDAPLSAMLPELAAQMRPDYRTVTLVQLLSHHAGFAHDIGDMAFLNSLYADKRSLPKQRLDYIARTLKEPPEIAPGTAFRYSNTGFLIAAVIAERATKTSYETLIRREVFGPLGMTTVGFGPTHDPQLIGHHGGKPIVRAEDSNPLMFAPARNMHMSLGDWAKFCLDQIAGGQGHGRLLSADSYRRMQTALPGGSSALAWGVQASLAGRQGPVLTHAGSDGNWNAIVALFPASGDGVLAAANADEDMGGDKATKAALMAVLPTLSVAKAP